MATVNLAGALAEIEQLLALIQQLEGIVKPLLPPAPKGPTMIARANAMSLSSSDSIAVGAVMTKAKAAMDNLRVCLEEKYE
jgi:hypothetical protein